MKKVVLTLALVAGFAFAANNVNAQTKSDKDQKKETTENVRTGFVDNNNDGVCDNYDGKRPGKGLGPGNGNGEGRGQGKGKGLGRRGNGQGRGGNGNFVDSNKNGTCDNQENGTGRLRDGSGRGQGNASVK